MDKEKWIDIGEIINHLRIIPRLLLVSFYGFAGWYVQLIAYKYMQLITTPDITDWKLAALSGFAAITIPAVTGIAAKLTDNYFRTGKPDIK